MIAIASNIARVREQIALLRQGVVVGQRAALDPAHWRSRAIAVARTAVEAVAHPADHPAIPIFLSKITATAEPEGFVLRLDPEWDPRGEAAKLDVRGIEGVPLFASAFARTKAQAWEIIRDWVEMAKDIDARDQDASGAVDYDRITSRIWRILYAPETAGQMAAREKILRTGDRGDGKGLYLLDFVAGFVAAGGLNYPGLNQARSWLAAVAAAWSQMIRTELPAAVVAQIHAAWRQGAKAGAAPTLTTTITPTPVTP